MTTPKSHHFVSDFLIKKFAFDGDKVFYLNKRSERKIPVPIKSSKVFYETNSNTFERPDGTKDFSVESALSILEGQVAVILLKIIASVELGKLPMLNSSEKALLDEFLLTLFKRSPQTRNKHATAAFFQESLAESLMELHAAGIHVPEELKTKFRSESWKKRTLKQAMVTATLRHGHEVNTAMSEKGLYFARPKNPKKTFILGSEPLLRLRGSKTNGIADPQSELWLPISPTIAISLYGASGRETLVFLEDQAVRYLNYHSWQQSESAVANNAELLNSIANAR